MTDSIAITAEHLLAIVTDPNPSLIHPDTLDGARSAYAWALTEAQTDMGRIEAHTVTNWSPIKERVDKGRRAKAIALAHDNRLAGMHRDEIRAECERVIAQKAAA